MFPKWFGLNLLRFLRKISYFSSYLVPKFEKQFSCSSHDFVQYVCYVHVLGPKKMEKLGHKAIKCVFLECPSNENGYRSFDPGCKTTLSQRRLLSCQINVLFFLLLGRTSHLRWKVLQKMKRVVLF